MKILVLQLKRIGDLVLSTPALVALRQHFPEASITLCVTEGSAGLTPAMPFVDKVLVLRQRGHNARIWTKLAVEKFDVCLDFTGTDRSAFFTLLSRASRRITFLWAQKLPFRSLIFTEFVDSSARENHTVDHYLDLLQPLGIRDHDIPVTLEIPPESVQKADQLLEVAGIRGKFVLVHPGTARPEKYWLPERWAEVIDYCQEKLGIPCVITGTHEAAEHAHIKAIGVALRTPFHDLSGQGDLLTLSSLIARAHLLLSMDSAPVHLGAAFQTRQVSLFGETNPYHWHPRHERSAILFAGNDQPLREFTTKFTRSPLSDLSTAAVIGAINSLL